MPVKIKDKWNEDKSGSNVLHLLTWHRTNSGKKKETFTYNDLVV